MICCLHDTYMAISKIKKYVSLLMNSGGESISERRDILLEHKEHLSRKIKSYQDLFQLTEKKLRSMMMP